MKAQLRQTTSKDTVCWLGKLALRPLLLTMAARKVQKTVTRKRKHTAAVVAFVGMAAAEGESRGRKVQQHQQQEQKDECQK